MSRASGKRKPKTRRSVNRPTGRLTEKPISDTATVALARYAAGLPLNIRGLETVLGISRAVIYRLKEDGPPFVQVAGGSRLYYPKDVEVWLRQHKHLANIQPDGGRHEQTRQ